MASVRKRTWNGADGAEKTAWITDYRDQDGKRHIQTFPTKKAAAAWLVDTQGEVSRGVHTPERASITVYEAAQLWLERGKVEGLERNTLVGYEALARLHIRPTLGPVKLAKLSTTMLESWRDRLLQPGSEHRKPLSRPLARKVLSTLKAILSEAQRRGLVAQNAALPVKVDTRKREVKKLQIGVDVPDKEDVQRLLVTVAADRWVRDRPLIVTAVFTGMRASELRGLPWEAVDFDKRTITVR
jgi:integrase